MLSRKNYQERLRKMEPKKERFSIRKFTVGAASVLIGFSFMGMSNSEKAQAADVNANSKPKVELTSKNESSEANKEQANTEAEKQAALNNNQVDKSTETKTVTNNEVKSEVAAAKAETTKTETAKVSDNKVATTELQLAKATTNNNQKQVAANTLKMQKNVTTSSATARSNDQTQDVTDTSSFINALKDANVGHIVLSNNIDFSQSNASDLNVNNTGSARAVTIEGNGHQLDFGQNAVTFNDSNQTNTTPIENNNWNITLDKVTIGSTGAKGIFDFSSLSAVNAAKNAVTFKNVTSTTDTNRVLSSAVNANFSGG